MTVDSPFAPFRTRFGMYVPCDRETYRKLKRIRHLAGFADAERRRWDRAQRRLPHNRAFKRRRGGGVVREPVDAGRMIFAPLFALAPAGAAAGFPADARLTCETELCARFMDDYTRARHPSPDPATVRPLRLSAGEVNELLEQIELWNLRR